ncbi:MAG: CDP-glycerol glycerophosphotransferase family protein [Erysipelotrichaceae bacterium]|nr:CDP-glycerol glycerophosphotransferase family protein [Erysipelotrichaceae bacterium]
MTYDNSYSCNPKYIVDELLKRNLDLDIVWAIPASTKAEPTYFPKEIKLVRRGSLEMINEQASARIWIDNALNCVWFDVPKKNGQVYINTWHGSMGIKKLSGNAHWMHRASLCRNVTDYIITNSTYDEEVFTQTFWKGVPFLKIGHPRNDLLMNEDLCKEHRKKVLEFYHLEEPCNIFMYAPTFRENTGDYQFDLDYEAVHKALTNRFGGKWYVIVRLHYKDKAKANQLTYNDHILNGTLYPDMQDLLAAADIGMSDYSSWPYDYILRRKPIFIYAPDLSDYEGGRGFYYPIETTPFPIARTNAEVLANIASFDPAPYAEGVEAFLKDKGCYETGQAAKLCVDFIIDIINRND